MPRKTRMSRIDDDIREQASMRPRPDATENVRLLIDLEDRLSRLQ